MSIIISLSPEVEARLLERAKHQEEDINIVATELLTRILDWEAQDSAEAVARIQEGLNDFEVGQSRSFQEFAEEKRRQYDLPIVL